MFAPCEAMTVNVEMAPPAAHSLQSEGEEEALRFKWILSEQAGRDLGEWAIRRWVSDHWNGFLRARWLDHLEGKSFWIELDPKDFGLLRDQVGDSVLLREILRRVKAGEENLGIILWAVRSFPSQADVDAILEILRKIDINSRRIECEFAKRLSGSV